MQVDVEQIRFAIGAMDHVAFPDLLGERAGHVGRVPFLGSSGAPG
jgi:hypothetical protein